MAGKTGCIKGFLHLWETIQEYPSHYIKQCRRCKQKNWIAKRD